MRHRSEPARAVQTAAAAAPRPRRRVASKSVAVSAEQKRKEAERFTTAMLSQIRFKCKTMRIVLPPICRCQYVYVCCARILCHLHRNDVWLTSPLTCANNCPFHHNVDGLLVSYNAPA